MTIDVTFGNFAPGEVFDIAIVPITADGTVGEPDNPITVTMDSPALPSEVPSTPTVVADALGNVAVSWDGLLSGAAPGIHFWYVRPEISSTGTGGWSPAGSQLSAAGSTVIQDVGAGTWYFRLVPVDTLGRDGTASSDASVAVSPTLGDLRTPSTPTGLSVTSAGFWSGSDPAASVTATWTAVTTATDTSSMTMTAYELWGKPSAATDYALLTVATGGQITVTVDSITPLSTSWDFKLRATGSNILQSAFSSVVTTTIALPSLALDPPTAPTLTSSRGLVFVSWDGNLVTSAPLAYAAPAYLANVDIWVSVDAGTTYTRMGFLSAGTRTESISGLGIGTDVMVTLIAVDRVGNATAASASDTVTVVGISGADLLANSLDANVVKAGTITADRVSSTFGADLNLSANGSITLLAGNVASNKTTADTTAANLASMQTRYSFTSTAAVISQPGSVFSVSISNTNLEFQEAGIARAYLNAGVFYAPKLSSQEIVLSKHVIMDDPSGNGTIIKRF